MKYQLNEIEYAKLKIGEDEVLEEQRKIIINSSKIAENLEIADNALSEQTIESINVAIKALEKIENIDEKYEKKLSNLKNIYYDIQEIARDINAMKDDVNFNEEERNNIEERLDTIFSLKRKYGNSIEEIIQYKEEIEKEIFEIENLDEINNKLKSELKDIELEMTKLSKQMNGIRIKEGKELSIKINKELKDLEMQNARIEAQVISQEEFNKNGLDVVELVISTNIGEEKKPLIKIASGGEMSRIMLAIKSVLAGVDKVPVLVFDEIDTGISGIAAIAVSMKMKNIARHHQVLCVTHLASIAAKGDNNYYISKEVKDDKTVTKIKLLTEEETIKEIARIASGDITEGTLKYAMELRKRAT